MTEQELRKYYDLIADAWKFFRSHSKVGGGDDYWNSVINEGQAVVEKHGNARIAKDLILSMISELERSARGQCTLIRP